MAIVVFFLKFDLQHLLALPDFWAAPKARPLSLALLAILVNLMTSP